MTVNIQPDPLQTQAGDELVMSILQEHVPLALLVDLTDTAGPASAEIMAEEGGPETRWWEGTGADGPRAP
jgi:hypothetical protein